MSSCFSYEALKIAYIAAFFPVFLVSLVGNIFIGIIVYKTKSLKKPVNYFIANMAMSDLVYPISMLPRDVASLFISGSWLVRGPLGQALRKLSSFSIEVSTLVSSQSLVLMAVNRFGAVVFYPQFPTDQFKQVPLLHSRHLDHCHGRQVPDSVLLYGFGVCRRAGMYAAVVSLLQTLHCGNDRCRLLCPISFDHHTLPYHRFNNQISENCERTISQQERSTFKERENRSEDLHCYRVSIYNGLAATQYLVVCVLLFIRQNSDMVLWISIFHGDCPIFDVLILCCKPLHLFYIHWTLPPGS